MFKYARLTYNNGLSLFKHIYKDEHYFHNICKYESDTTPIRELPAPGVFIAENQTAARSPCHEDGRIFHHRGPSGRNRDN